MGRSRKKIAILTVGFLALSYVIFSFSEDKSLDGTGIGCIELQSGTASLIVNFPDSFVNVADSIGIIRLRLKPSSGGENTSTNVIGAEVHSVFNSRIDELIANEAKDNPNLNYEEAMLDGREVVLAKANSENYHTQLYLIPVGNRVLRMFYNQEGLSEEHDYLARSIIENVKIAEKQDDQNSTIVSKCNL